MIMDVQDRHGIDPSGRVLALERSLRRTQFALVACTGTATLVITAGMAAPAGGEGAKRADERQVSEVLYTRRLVVVDDQGVVRATIGQDPLDSGRRSRSAGVLVYDKHGDERGGLGTFDDDSAAMALDAPRGVGDPMRDRIGMMVAADGGSQLLVLDNQTRGVVKLVSYGDGRGGVQLFRWEEDSIRSKTLSYDGELLETSARTKR
jgi:hypothetical protein